MTSFVDSLYRESPLGERTQLPEAGTALENPFVYDSVARELEALARRGLVRIESSRERHVSGERLIASLTFTRLR